MKDKSEILRLIYQDYESRNRDYKSSMPWTNDNQYDIVKDIMAFANYGGGYIVVGYDEAGETDIEKRTGIQKSDRNTWETTIVNQAVANFSDPPIDVDLIDVPDEVANVSYLVLHIPSHGSVPHICKRDRHDSRGKKHLLRKAAVYYRTTSKSCEEISTSSDYHKLIRACLINDRGRILRDFQQILFGKEVSKEGRSQESPDAFKVMEEQSRLARQLVKRQVSSERDTDGSSQY